MYYLRVSAGPRLARSWLRVSLGWAPVSSEAQGPFLGPLVGGFQFVAVNRTEVQFSSWLASRGLSQHLETSLALAPWPSPHMATYFFQSSQNLSFFKKEFI